MEMLAAAASQCNPTREKWARPSSSGIPDPHTGRWSKTRYRMTESDAQRRFGADAGRLEWSREVRDEAIRPQIRRARGWRILGLIPCSTLLVLGACASKPYGLPLGSELRADICAAAREGNATTHAVAQDGRFVHHEIQHVAKTFLRSGVNSIDAFLARYDHLVGAGKALIAALLCSRENPDNIFSEDNPDHWYRLLWNVLIDGARHDLKQNNVRFLTFNYDRSLEYFLHEATKGTFGLNDTAAFAEWSQMEVLHVYGSVGEFNFADGEHIGRTRPYSTEIRPRELEAAAAGINIIPEGRDDAPVFGTARQWFAWAKRVYVLGFGFDRLNCDRLGFAQILQAIDAKTLPIPGITMSVFGLTPAESARAEQNLFGRKVYGLTTYGEKNVMTLRLAGLPD